MTGAREIPLYIGQSGNLRARLAYYKNARPGTAPQKIVRLLSRVESVTWEVCESPDGARLRENELLRLHRPRFNRLNTYPQRRECLAWRLGLDGVELARFVKPFPGWNAHGTFKASTALALGAMARLIWASARNPKTVHDFPALFFQGRTPGRMSLPVSWTGAILLTQLLEEFLAGESRQLLDELRRKLDQAGPKEHFLTKSQEKDLEDLETFFLLGPARNHALKRRYEIKETILSGPDLDDLI